MTAGVLAFIFQRSYSGRGRMQQCGDQFIATAAGLGGKIVMEMLME